MTDDRRAGLVAGAVIGVLLTLGTLLGVVSSLDERWVTRREWVLTIKAQADSDAELIQRLRRIEAKIDKVADGG